MGVGEKERGRATLLIDDDDSYTETSLPSLILPRLFVEFDVVYKKCSRNSSLGSEICYLLKIAICPILNNPLIFIFCINTS